MPCSVQMGLVMLHASVGGLIYYGYTWWILDVWFCLTLLGPMCLCCGMDSASCWYRTHVFSRNFCLCQCRKN